MKITKKQLRRIIREERARLAENPNVPDVMGAMGGGKFQPRQEEIDVEEIIAQGREFFDKVIQLSQDSEDDPKAQEAIDQIEAALSADVEKKSYGYVKLKIIS